MLLLKDMKGMCETLSKDKPPNQHEFYKNISPQTNPILGLKQSNNLMFVTHVFDGGLLTYWLNMSIMN